MVRIVTRHSALEEVSADLVAVGLFDGEEPPAPLMEMADVALSSGDFSGKRGETTLLYTRGALSSPRLLLLGLG